MSLASVQNEINALTQRTEWLREQLDRHSFNARGEKVYALHPSERASFEMELASHTEALDIADRTRLLVLERREQETGDERVKVENAAAVEEFVNGDPTRAAALKDAMLRREADVMAEWLLRRQYRIG